MTTASPKTSFRERWFAFRNARLADPAFQRWAAKFPLTRPIAAQRAKGLFDICSGFVYSQVLLACSRLKLFEALRDGPLSPETLAQRLNVPADRLTPLLTAASSLDLVEPQPGGTYGLGVHGAAYLGNPAIGSMLEHHALLYQDLQDPLALLRGEKTDTALSAFWPYREGAPPTEGSNVAPYGEIMSDTQAFLADDILDAYPFEGHRKLLDIGGGQGTFLLSVAKRRPDLKLVLFDLPPMIARAKEKLGSEHLTTPVEFVGGDFRTDPLPEGADLVSLVRIAHDHDDATVAALLRKIFEILPPGGILMLAEPLAQTPGAEAAGAYFAFYLMAMGQGRPRSADELQNLLYKAGFARVRLADAARPLLTSVLIAQKSAGRGNRM